MVTRVVPAKETTEAGTKPEPVTVMVAEDVAPTFRTDGDSLSAPTGGLLIASGTAAEVPPPGLGLDAARARLLAAVKSLEGSAALTWVALMYVVARAEPLTVMTVEGTKPVPVKVMTAEGVPASAVVADMEVMTGAGLSISRLIVELLTVPFATATGSSAPFVSWAAGTVAVSCVALT